jgi:signal transduction histidine kinase
MNAEWRLVLSRDGTVLAASDGAPHVWVARRLADCADAPAEAKVAVGSVETTVYLTVVDALPLRRVPTDLRTLLESALSVVRRQASELDVRLNLAVREGVPSAIPIDADWIAWASTVLVGNALRYVRPGSGLMAPGLIDVCVAYDAATEEVSIEVRDNGPGIPPDRLSSLFEGEPGRPRLGLGLVMVRDVVVGHGGRIEVRSETVPFAGGTTVRLTLPVW